MKFKCIDYVVDCINGDTDCEMIKMGRYENLISCMVIDLILHYFSGFVELAFSIIFMIHYNLFGLTIWKFISTLVNNGYLSMWIIALKVCVWRCIKEKHRYGRVVAMLYEFFQMMSEYFSKFDFWLKGQKYCPIFAFERFHICPKFPLSTKFFINWKACFFSFKIIWLLWDQNQNKVLITSFNWFTIFEIDNTLYMCFWHGECVMKMRTNLMCVMTKNCAMIICAL